MGQNRRPHQRDVVCKITLLAPGETEAPQSPRFAPEESCCWQDGRRRSQLAKRVRHNISSRELRCCLKDCTAPASGPAVSAAGGCARQARGASRGIVSSNPDGGRTIFADCRGTPRDIPDRPRFSLCGSRCAAFAGTRLRRKLSGVAGTSMVGKSACNSDSAVDPYGRCPIRLPQI